jgi:CRISPR/Cas system CSM-associated protein Csm3 (group 7 of RAMP superfamily)
MNQATLVIEVASWWHAGSGESGPGDLDAIVARDQDGLPFLPGKTLKGLLRDAAWLHSACAREGNGAILLDPAVMFGYEGGDKNRPPGRLQVSNARMPQAFQKWASGWNTARPELAGLYETIASTAIASDFDAKQNAEEHPGIARRGSLRKIEVVLPMRLEAVVSWEASEDDDNVKAWLDQIVRLIRRMGSHRHRGLGRCRVTVESPVEI